MENLILIICFIVIFIVIISIVDKDLEKKDIEKITTEKNKDFESLKKDISSIFIFLAIFTFISKLIKK